MQVGSFIGFASRELNTPIEDVEDFLLDEGISIEDRHRVIPNPMALLNQLRVNLSNSTNDLENSDQE